MNSIEPGDARHSQRPPETPEGPWPQFQADPQRTGQGHAKAAAGRERWVIKKDISLIIAAPVVGADHTVYIGAAIGPPPGSDDPPEDTFPPFSAGRRLFAVDGSTGAVRWRFGGPDDNFGSSAAVSRRRVFVGCGERLYALDAATGRENWSFKAHSDIIGSPVLSPDGTLYFSDHANHLFALDAATSRVKWEFTSPDRESADSTPAMGPDGTVYMGSGGDGRDTARLYALDGAAGAVKWTFVTGRGAYSIAVDGQNHVLIGSGHGAVHCLDGATGQERWQRKLGDQLYARLAIGPDGVAYLGVGDKLYALESATGKERWVVKMDGGYEIYSSVAIAADGVLYVGDMGGYFHALDSRTGATIWRFRADSPIISSPAIDSDGAVYFASMNSDRASNLYALE